MQTFLPAYSMIESVKVLDNKRLGKQRVEALQIIKAITIGPGYGWQNHPAVLMWKGALPCLKYYHNRCIIEWKARGFNNNMPLFRDLEEIVRPVWMGDERFHASHRANLLRKDPEHYGQFGWTEDPTMKYFWPTHHEEYKVKESA